MMTIEQLEDFVKELNDSGIGEGFLNIKVKRSGRTGVRWTRTKKAKGYPLWNNVMKEHRYGSNLKGEFQVSIVSDEKFIEETKKDIKEIVENLKEMIENE